MENKALVINYFEELRNNNFLVDEFFSYLTDNQVHYAALGGSVRAALNPEKKEKLRDVDIVFKTENQLILSFLQERNVQYHQNSFNGLKFTLDSVEFDAWNIMDHYYYKNSLHSKSFENLYKTTLLNYDSLAYDFSKQILYDKYYNEYCNERKIDIVRGYGSARKNPNKPLTICKIFEIERRENVRISHKTMSYIKDYCRQYRIDECIWELKKAYRRHYQKQMNDRLYEYIKKQLRTIVYN